MTIEVNVTEYFILLLQTKTGRHDGVFVWLQSRVTLIGANTFVFGSVVAFPADVFVWLPSGVTLVGANTFVVGSQATQAL